MAVTATLTGTAGPGGVVTAQVFTDVLTYTVDSTNNVVQMTFSCKGPLFISVNAATTVTGTKFGQTWTLVIS